MPSTGKSKLLALVPVQAKDMLHLCGMIAEQPLAVTHSGIAV